MHALQSFSKDYKHFKTHQFLNKSLKITTICYFQRVCVFILYNNSLVFQIENCFHYVKQVAYLESLIFHSVIYKYVE